MNNTFYSQESLTTYSVCDSIPEEYVDAVEEERRVCIIGEANKDRELSDILANHFNFVVLRSERGLEYRSEDDIIFVLADFERSEAFNYLHSISRLIMGPAVVRQCFASQQPLPVIRPNRPLYCCSMKKMRFCISGYATTQTRRAVDLIHFMGGSARREFNKESDMLIAGTVHCSKYRRASKANQLILTLQWVEACWARRDETDFAAGDNAELMQAHRLRCFQGLRLHFADTADERELQEMGAEAVEHGAEVVARPDQATHVICAREEQPLPMVSDTKTAYVTREWFWRSVHLERCEQEDGYSALTPLSHHHPNQQPPPSRPLQPRENLHAHSHHHQHITPLNRRRNADPSSAPAITTFVSPKTPEESLRKSLGRRTLNATTASTANTNNASKASLDNLENSNNSSALPEHLFSTEDLLNCTPKKDDKRYMVCEEFLHTEENYVRCLSLIIKIYKTPLEEKLGTNEEILSKKEIAILFGKLPAILQVHTHILQQIRTLMRDWHSDNLMGMVWAHCAMDFAKIYPPYLNNYEEMLRTLDYCDAARPKFHSFLKMTESNPECQRHDLKSLMAKPFQRLPSVILLLMELLKRTKESNPDYQWLKGAVLHVKAAMEKANESRRRAEDFQRQMEIFGEIEDLPTDIIASHRQLIHSIDVVVLDAGGALQKYRGRTLGLFLFTDLVVLAKSRSAFSSNLMNNSTLLNTSTSTALNTSSAKSPSFSGGSGCRSSMKGSLKRHLSFSISNHFKRRERESKPYRYIVHHRFVAFRAVELVRTHGLFIVTIRDAKSDEPCFLQMTNGYPLEAGIDLFETLIKGVNTHSNRDIILEELTEEKLLQLQVRRPEDYAAISKAMSMSSELTDTGIIRRPSHLRRTVSNVSLGLSATLQRFTSKSRLSMNPIGEN